MPGLIRGIARTAVVAGTATAVSNRVSRRQGERWQRQGEQEQVEQPDQQPEPDEAAPEPEPGPPAPTMDDKLEQLKKLAELKDQGVLTDEEFADQKARILG